MAFLFRPFATKPIPAGAEACRVGGKACVRWAKRGGGTVTAEVVAATRCRVRSPVWWVEYRDAHGVKRRVGVSRDRQAAEHRMAQLVTDVERQKGGLLPKAALPTGETLMALAGGYRRHLADMGRTGKHIADTFQRITTVVTDCGWTTAADVTLARWVRWVGEARGAAEAPGYSAETINHYLRSLRSFFRWIGADPLAKAELLNADADRRIVRRVLTADEFRRLIDSTRAGEKVRLGLDGPARAALYLLAARTGLRAGVLARLTPESLRLDADTPHVPVEARRQKNRRAQLVPIPRAALAELREWLDARPADRPLWPGNWHRHHRAADMVRRDLRAAGIKPVTGDGTYDFHALRSQFVTDLALAGVPVQVAQQLAGHSTPTLTSRYYTRLGLADLGAAADRLGSELGSNTPNVPQILGGRKGKAGGPKGPGSPGEKPKDE